MGEVNGFMKYPRETPSKEIVEKRIVHFKEYIKHIPPKSLRRQGARCMDCGVPFCHQACPLGNVIPEWNHLTSEKKWEEALEVLHSTNNFPEFTGRVCPAPCESACVLGINEDPVAIESIEMALADMGFENGWVQPILPEKRLDSSVAVVGSGPAGLAAAQELNRKGYRVVLLERDDRPGGLLMYGIPDFKLEKSRVLRRIKQIEDEGVEIRCNVQVGSDVTLEDLQNDFDAVLLLSGSTGKRDLPIEGRDLKGIYFADDLLRQSTRRVLGDDLSREREVHTKDRDVIVIGGGDTGSDCVGTANRQGAKSITQFELMPMPPALGKFPRADARDSSNPWPEWPYMLRTSYSHEEGGERYWAVQSEKFLGDEQGQVKALRTVEIDWSDQDGKKVPTIKKGSEKDWPCDIAFLAIGFTGAEKAGLVSSSNLQLDPRGNVLAGDVDYMSSIEGVFVAGDMRRGQSLVVWAIREGRMAAQAVSQYLEKSLS